VRPYYKPYRVGSQVYRGANAGDFAGINVIDMSLGLCFANDPDYSQMLVDKFLYMMPEDQRILRECMCKTSLMDDFLAQSQHYQASWYQENLKLFLKVCDRHGQTAIRHHDQLVNKYISNPAITMEQQHMDKVTASGPPLAVLLNTLENLRDKRAAFNRTDIRTCYADIQRLKATLNTV
jgi:hypothetical protein